MWSRFHPYLRPESSLLNPTRRRGPLIFSLSSPSATLTSGERSNPDEEMPRIPLIKFPKRNLKAPSAPGALPFDYPSILLFYTVCYSSLSEDFSQCFYLFSIPYSFLRCYSAVATRRSTRDPHVPVG